MAGWRFNAAMNKRIVPILSLFVLFMVFVYIFILHGARTLPNEMRQYRLISPRSQHDDQASHNHQQSFECSPMKSLTEMCRLEQRMNTRRQVTDPSQEPDIETFAAIRGDNRIYARVWPRMRNETSQRKNEFVAWPWLVNPNVNVNPGGEHKECAGYEYIFKTDCPIYVWSNRKLVPGVIGDEERWILNDFNQRNPRACMAAEVNMLHQYDKLATVISYYSHHIGHFPIQVLPRLILLLEKIPKDVKVLLWTVAIPSYGSHMEKWLEELDRLGLLHPERVVGFEYGHTYAANELYFSRSSTWKGLTPGINQFGVNSYHRVREKFQVVPAPESKRYIVVIERLQERSIHNRNVLHEALEAIDEVVYFSAKGTLREDIDIFRHAYVVISPHGAGAANMLWQPPGTSLVEICYDDSKEEPCPTMYFNLAVQMGIDYWVSLSQGTYRSMMTVNVEEIVKIVTQIKAEKEAGLHQQRAREYEALVHCEETVPEPEGDVDEYKHVKVSDLPGYKNRRKYVEDSPYYIP